MCTRLKPYSINTEISVKIRVVVDYLNQNTSLSHSNFLLDIAHHEDMNLFKIEEVTVFLTAQCSERKYVMGGVDKERKQK